MNLIVDELKNLPTFAERLSFDGVLLFGGRKPTGVVGLARQKTHPQNFEQFFKLIDYIFYKKFPRENEGEKGKLQDGWIY